MLRVAYSPIYSYKLPKGHRFPMSKYDLLPEQLLYEGTLTEQNFFHPSPFSLEDLSLVHTSDYIRKLVTGSLTKDEIRRIGFPVRPGLIERGKHIAHGTYECTLYAMQYGVSMNIAGGTHHAFADRGEGFCIFNDFALAAKHMLDTSNIDRILIIDLDVHQGNGTAHIFSDDVRVFTFSMHGKKNYPLRKASSDLDVELDDGCRNNVYMHHLEVAINEILENFTPDLVLYLAGVDVLESDKLGRLSLTKDGCRQRDKYIFELCKHHNIPVAVSMGGGYSPKISDIVEAHANTFRMAQETFF